MALSRRDGNQEQRALASKIKSNALNSELMIYSKISILDIEKFVLVVVGVFKRLTANINVVGGNAV